jgi:hypothetical protein
MRQLTPYMLGLLLLVQAAPALTQPQHYGKGAVIDPAITVADATGSSVSLSSVLAEQPDALHVLFIFGGGDMGGGMPGHLWCADSFEDTHILRTLHGKYAAKGVRFIPVAVPPAYHSQMLGQPARVFLDAAADSPELATARQAFIDSTLAAQAAGMLPEQPWFDLHLNLMLNRSEGLLPATLSSAALPGWQGAFRAAGETQFYGVPSFWILSADGRVLHEPFRGNVYHPHGGSVQINYTFADLDAALQQLLEP